MNYDKIDLVCSKLKILGKLEPGEKIIFQDQTIEVIDFSTYNLGRVRKWYHDETRVSIRQKLKDFYRDVEDITNTLLNNPPTFINETELKSLLDRLLRDLKKSTKGVNNLILTYNEDKTTRSELENVLEKIQSIVRRIHGYFGVQEEIVVEEEEEGKKNHNNNNNNKNKKRFT